MIDEDEIVGGIECNSDSVDGERGQKALTHASKLSGEGCVVLGSGAVVGRNAGAWKGGRYGDLV